MEYVEEWFLEDLGMSYGAVLKDEEPPNEPNIFDMTPQSWVDYLNRLVELDVSAVDDLIGSRVPCNEVLARDPYVQVVQTEGSPHTLIGFLGVLNGFLAPQGYQVLAVFRDSDDTLQCFTLRKL